jgi:hypothetical protein
MARRPDAYRTAETAILGLASTLTAGGRRSRCLLKNNFACIGCRIDRTWWRSG